MNDKLIINIYSYIHMTNVKVNNSREIKGICIVLSLSFAYFLYTMYPRRLDMNYLPFINSASGFASGFFDINASATAGVSIFTFIISIISNIPIEEVRLLPIILIPLVLLLVTILRTIFQKNNIYLLIVASYIFTINYPAAFTAGVHEIGFILLLLMVTLLLIYYQNNFSPIAITAILIGIVVLINYISYKITFLMIGFLAVTSIASYILDKKLSPFKLSVIIIPIVIGLAINPFFYSSFLPYLENSYIYSSGFERYIQSNIGTSINANDPYQLLIQYYDTIPTGLRLISLVRSAFILLCLPICILVVVRKYFVKGKVSTEEMVLFALVISAISTLVLYAIMGNLDLTYLYIYGLLGFGLLYNNFKNHRKIIAIIIIMLTFVSAIYTCLLIYDDRYSGHRDYFNDKYIFPSYNWTSRHLDMYNNYLSSDWYTGDYFSYQSLKENNNSRYIQIQKFQAYDLLLLLKNEESIEKSSYNKYYIINYKLDYFVIERWYQFKSWRLYESNIRMNPFANKVYTTKSIDIIIY